MQANTVSANIEHANYHNLILEVAWFGLALAATTRFLSVYAIRLGATPAELGWITALPFVVLLGSTAFSTRWRNKFSNSVAAIFLPSLGFRLVFLLPAFTPLFPHQWQPTWLIVATALTALPQGISATIFMSLLRDAIPEEKLTKLISRRNVGMNISLGISVLAFGFWLEQAPFPLNYQSMFLAAFVLAMMSQIVLMRVRVESSAPSAPVRVLPVMKDTPLHQHQFQKTLFVSVIIHLGFFAIVPVTPLHLVRSLGAAEGFMALFGLAEIGAAAIISIFTTQIAVAIGYRRMIGLAMIGTAVAALLLATAITPAIALLAAAISGAAWTTATVGLFGLFMHTTSNVSRADMTRYTTVYHQVIFVAAFIGPMIGSQLAQAGAPLLAVMLLGATLRLAAGTGVMAVDWLWTWFSPRFSVRRATSRG
jgi:MFS family permease